jgi:hypothetical protein
VLALDGKNDHYQLNFGWYYPENDGTIAFRWSAPVASALFRLRKPVLNCSVTFLGTSAPSQPRIAVRPLGSLDAVEAASLPAPAAPGWHTRSVPLHLAAGDYELILLCEPGVLDQSGRRLGLAVASIGFE